MTDPRDLPARHLSSAVDLSSIVSRAEAPPRCAGDQPAPGGGPATAGGAGRAEGAPAAGDVVASLPDAVVDGDPRLFEQFVQLSQFLPVLVEMHSAANTALKQTGQALASIVRAQQGRTVLLRLDLDAYPDLGAQAQVVAIISGRPLPLIASPIGADELEQLVAELLQVAAQQGLNGRVTIEGAAGQEQPDQGPAEPEIPPHLEAAYAAIERRDYREAIAEYERVLTERPADDEAKAGLAQVKLLDRLDGKSLDEIRNRAALAPGDLDAQLDVADLDLSGGHVQDAFDRILDLYPTLDQPGKDRARERLLELFVVVGDDPRVGAARARLASMLF